MNLTKLERDFIKTISVSNFNGDTIDWAKDWSGQCFENWEEDDGFFETFVEAKDWGKKLRKSEKAIGGVMSSLIDKKMIVVSDVENYGAGDFRRLYITTECFNNIKKAL